MYIRPEIKLLKVFKNNRKKYSQVAWTGLQYNVKQTYCFFYAVPSASLRCSMVGLVCSGTLTH